LRKKKRRWSLKNAHLFLKLIGQTLLAKKEKVFQLIISEMMRLTLFKIKKKMCMDPN
jgi:hypothetical protein